MSRVGKKPINIPSGVQITNSAMEFVAKGKLGELRVPLTDKVHVAVNDNQITVNPIDESIEARTLWGTTRNLIDNVVKGVSEGFTIVLEINGVGYRAAVQGSTLVLNLGFSHDVNFPLPEGIKATCPKPTEIILEGSDRQKLGQAAAKIRSYRPPEPYKGKGIKYKDEIIVRKEGKKK